MKLYWSSRSPYVRKVMIVAHEIGLADRIECERVAVTAFVLNTDMLQRNPLGKIPTLIPDDGEPIYDSRVVCEYLDSLHGGTRLFPDAWPERLKALRWQALGDGMLDLMLQRLYETRVREETQRSPELLDVTMSKLSTCLAALEATAGELSATPFGIGHVAIGTALSYIDFRYAEDNWRDGRPSLTAWHDAFRQRPSVIATEFADVR